MSKDEAREIMQTMEFINDRSDKQRYLAACLKGLRSVDFYEFFNRDYMRKIGLLFRIKYATRLDKWDLCEEVDKVINDL